MSKSDIYQRCVNAYGESAQLRQVIEECAELITAITKYARYPGIPQITRIVEESIDVELMLKQIRRMFPDSNSWKIVMHDKKKRLLEKLAKVEQRKELDRE